MVLKRVSETNFDRLYAKTKSDLKDKTQTDPLALNRLRRGWGDATFRVRDKRDLKSLI